MNGRHTHARTHTFVPTRPPTHPHTLERKNAHILGMTSMRYCKGVHEFCDAIIETDATWTGIEPRRRGGKDYVPLGAVWEAFNLKYITEDTCKLKNIAMELYIENERSKRNIKNTKT